MMGEWLLALEAAIEDAQEAGELSRELDSEQLAFEINSLGMGANWAFQLYRDDDGIRARPAGDPRAPLGPDRKSSGRDASRSRPRSTRAPPAARCATRSRSSSASWRRCSSTARPGAARLAGQLARRSARARRRRPRGASRRARRAASRTPGARFASGPRPRRRTATASRRWSRIPPSHKWQRVSNDDIGEPGCKYYHSTPAPRPRRDADGLVAREDLVRMPIAVPDDPTCHGGARWSAASPTGPSCPPRTSSSRSAT